MTIITLHHLFFGHCVNSSVICLDLGIFLRELRSLRKIPRSKIITSDFTHNDLKRDGVQLLLSKYTIRFWSAFNQTFFWNFDHNYRPLKFQWYHWLIHNKISITEIISCINVKLTFQYWPISGKHWGVVSSAGALAGLYIISTNEGLNCLNL